MRFGQFCEDNGFLVSGDDWKDGEEIHLTSARDLRTDANEDEQDNLGKLREFATDRCRL